MTLDKRKSPRSPGNNKAAVIYAKSGLPPIMCTVADISEGGAGLTVVSVSILPDTFQLEIKGDSKVYSCKVAWRKEPHRLGVSFEAAPAPEANA